VPSLLAICASCASCSGVKSSSIVFRVAEKLRFEQVSRTGAVLVINPRRLGGCKTRTQLIPRYAFSPVKLGQSALNLDVDRLFASHFPDLSL
jgi:hypothetical protein